VSTTHPTTVALGVTRRTGGKHRAFQADMLSHDAIRTMHTAVCTELGTVDILYANHGVTGQMIGLGGNIEDLHTDEFENAWRVNTSSSFLVRPQCTTRGVVLTARSQLAQLCVPQMARQKWGRVVFCSRCAAHPACARSRPES
jgi:3-oxoacyl-[acyl-carrier protein] reductase